MNVKRALIGRPLANAEEGHKLEVDPTQPCCLLTETGMGYRFRPIAPVNPP